MKKPSIIEQFTQRLLLDRKAQQMAEIEPDLLNEYLLALSEKAKGKGWNTFTERQRYNTAVQVLTARTKSHDPQDPAGP